MYGKIFESIFRSTLVSDGGWLPNYIFMSMIVLADKDGIVDFSSKALFNHIGFRSYDSKITLDDFKEAIKYLTAEDEESNSTAENGRRIIPLSEIDEIEGNRGWFIVNYEMYRVKASKHDKREATAERVRRFREREKTNKNKEKETCNAPVTHGNATKREETPCNAPVTHSNACDGHTDTDIDTDTDLGKASRPKSKPQSKKQMKFSPNSIEFRLADLLHKIIKNRNPNFKKPNMQKWSEHVDSMIRLDRRAPDDIATIIKWSQKDRFWYKNILSTDSLREKFDRLWDEMNGPNPGQKISPSTDKVINANFNTMMAAQEEMLNNDDIIDYDGGENYGY